VRTDYRLAAPACKTSRALLVVRNLRQFDVAARMKREARGSLKAFLIELAVYAALVTAYFFLVLAFLGEWLEKIYRSGRHLYAVLALALIVSQGIALEAVTTALLAFIRSRRGDE